MRKYDDAVQQLRKLLDMEPNYALAPFRLGAVYHYQGHFAEAIAEFEKVIKLSNRNPMILARLGNAYASGRRDVARNIIGELQELSKRVYASPFHVALVHVGLGEKERAFECLERAYQDRGGELYRLRVEPLLEPLHRDPRFVDLAHRMHLPS
jgi:serine/threonine-protein kinase